MNSATDTTVSLLTPPGRGALATISVRGPRAWQVTNACLTQSVEFEPAALLRPWLREFRSIHGTGEELVVCFPSEATARIHCHGGLAACEAVLRALEQQGAVREGGLREGEAPAEPSPPSTSQAAARQALARALTERTALILLDQYQGALATEIHSVLNLLAHSADHVTSLARLATLLSRVPLGLHLTQPWQVVLAGRPNAGKSSLLNALLGFQRSITSAEPGTTRDVVTARTAFDGWPVELRDTAGLRTSTDAIEIAGVERAEQELRAADLVLGLIPANETADDAAAQLQELRQLRANGPLLIVRTKADLNSLPRSNSVLAVSAITGAGLPELATAIVAHLVGLAPPPGAAVPFLDEQRIVLEQAHAALRAGNSTAAARLLQSLSISATSEP